MRFRPKSTDVIAVQAPPEPDTLADLLFAGIPGFFGVTVKRKKRIYRDTGPTSWGVRGHRSSHEGASLTRGEWLIIEGAEGGKPRLRVVAATEFATGFDPLPDDGTRERLENLIVGTWARDHFTTGSISLDSLDQTSTRREPIWQHPAAQAEIDRVRDRLSATGARWYQPAYADEIARWDALRATVPVPVRVEPQLRDPRHPTWINANQPRHIVPDADFRGPRRHHQAGLPLCATPARKTPLPLAGSSTGVPTCERCLTQLQPRPTDTTSGGPGTNLTAHWTTGADPIWDALNPRQKHYLEVIFHGDQDAEVEHTTGDWRDRPDIPAAEWRQLTFDLSRQKNTKTGEGYSAIQRALRARGIHDPGAGSTLDFLAERELIAVTHDTEDGSARIRVRITNLGRKVARAGLGATGTTAKPRGLLTEWGWRSLVRLYAAGEDGLRQDSSVPFADRLPPMVVENLIYQRNLAETCEGWGARIRCTALGRLHYEIHHRCYGEWYPEIDAPDPDQPHPHAHADLAAHNTRTPRGLVTPPDIEFYLRLLVEDERPNPWPRRELVRHYRDRDLPVPQDVLDVPPGIWLRHTTGHRRKSKTVDRLRQRREGALITIVDAPSTYTGSGHEPLVTLTDLGRQHADEHEQTYRKLYPEDFARIPWPRKET